MVCNASRFHDLLSTKLIDGTFSLLSLTKTVFFHPLSRHSLLFIKAHFCHKIYFRQLKCFFILHYGIRIKREVKLNVGCIRCIVHLFVHSCSTRFCGQTVRMVDRHMVFWNSNVDNRSENFGDKYPFCVQDPPP